LAVVRRLCHELKVNIAALQININLYWFQGIGKHAGNIETNPNLGSTLIIDADGAF